MAKITDLLSRFRSYSRPSLSGSSSGAFSSLAKKQQSAEDAIIDNQYSDGNLSAQSYLDQLNTRLYRSGVTPAQKVSLQEKIKTVQTTVNDAEVARQYAAGSANTTQVYNYEKAKLDKMTPGSATYIKQQQTVQGLKDKAEKESRTAFRVAQNLAISKMPEDTSANLWAKAQEYQKLASQAQLDGDQQQADIFSTQMNNYTNSAKKADVNDLITGTRLSVSGTPDAGTGIPSADVGAQLFAKFTGQGGAGGNQTSGGTGASGSAVAPAATGFSGFQSPAVKNALESLDRSEKTLERLYQQKSDKEALVKTYQDAVNKSTGDQKTALTVALNNHKQDLANLDNTIGTTTQGIQDTVVRIQEAQQKAASGEFSQEVRQTNMKFDQAESQLETAFAKGQISKEEYIQKGIDLAATKTQYLSEASGVFSQFGNDISAETYLQKSADVQKIHESLINVGQNINDYAPIVTDPNGKVTNLFGKTLQPGEVALTNVRQLRDAGQFDSNYTQVGNAYYRIHYPGEVSDVTGLPQSPAFNKQLGQLKDNAFIYKVGQDGKTVAEKVRSVQLLDENNQPINQALPETQINQRLGAQNLIQDNGKFRIKTQKDFLKEVPKQGILPDIINAPAYAVKQKIADIFKNVPSSIQKTVSNVSGAAKQTVADFFKPAGINLPQNLVNTAGNFVQAALNKGQNAVSGIKNFVASASQNSGIKFPDIVPNAYAADSGVGGLSTTDLIKNALQDEGILNDKVLAYALATADHETAGTFKPISEIGGASQAAKLNYPGGANYAGRGYIQLTGIGNYQKYGQRLGLDLVNHPELANDPVNASRILAAYFKDRGTADAINRGDLVGARKTINNDNLGGYIAQKFQDYLPKVADFITKPFVPAAYATDQQIVDDYHAGKINKTQADQLLNTPRPTPSPLLRSQQSSSDPLAGLRSAGNNISQGVQQATQNVQKAISQPVQAVQKAVSNFQLPKIQLPSIQIPQFKMPTINLQPVQNFVQQAVPKVQQTVSNIGSTIGNIFKNLKFW